MTKHTFSLAEKRTQDPVWMIRGKVIMIGMDSELTVKDE